MVQFHFIYDFDLGRYFPSECIEAYFIQAFPHLNGFFGLKAVFFISKVSAYKYEALKAF